MTNARNMLMKAGGSAFRLVDHLLPHAPLADKQVTRVRYWRAHGRMPRALTDPQATFNDYIYHRISGDLWTPLERICVDKQYAKMIAPVICPAVHTATTECVLPLSGPASLARIRRELAARSGRLEVVKPTHGSGSVLFLRNRPSTADIAAFCDSATCSYYDISRESLYRGQERKIIIEGDLSSEGTPPADYKFFCARGEVLFCQVDTGRFVDHRRALFSPAFEPLDVRYAHDAPDELPPKPDHFDDMLGIASELSRGFAFVRTDLYSVRGAVYFGEFTFAPEGGAGPLSSEAFGISVMEKIREAAAREEMDT